MSSNKPAMGRNSTPNRPQHFSRKGLVGLLSALSQDRSLMQSMPLPYNSCHVLGSPKQGLLLMIKVLHHLVYIYMHYSFVYYTTKFPMLLVYRVYIKSCRISIINSISPCDSHGSSPRRFSKRLAGSSPVRSPVISSSCQAL